MVFIAPIIGATLLLSGVSALPTRRSSHEASSYEGSSYEGSGSGSQYDNSYDNSKENTYDNSYEEHNTYEENKYTPPYEENKYETTTYEENKYTPPYDNNKYETTTYEENKYTTEENKYTTEENKYTTTYEENKYTTTTKEYKPQETYGSGKPYWGGNEYQDCVNKCIADFPPESSGGGYSNDGGSGSGESSGESSNEKEGTYQATQSTGSGGTKGTGATHTVIVAPSKGVFRMVPFALNASVGDNIEFRWGAPGHNIKKSSQLTPCNASSDADAFVSGLQGEGFVFNQEVKTTEPTYYFCSVPTHCAQGMFGIINPNMATPGDSDSFSGNWADMAANSSDLAAFAAYSDSLTANSTKAASWGSGLSLKDMPEWAKPLMASNILFNRALLAQNPEVLKDDNTVDLSSAKDTPLMVPRDITQALNNAGAAPASNAPSAPAAPTPDNAAAAAGSSPSASPTGGASSLASSRVLVGAVVVLATFFAL